jgi:hypothetical protein
MVIKYLLVSDYSVQASGTVQTFLMHILKTLWIAKLILWMYQIQWKWINSSLEIYK